MIIKIEITLPKNNRELRSKIDKELKDIQWLIGQGWDTEDTKSLLLDTEDTKLRIDTSFEDE